MLVSWSLTPFFSTNMGVSETKDQGWRSIPTQQRKASDTLTSTMAPFCSAANKKGKGIDSLIYIIMLALTTGGDNYHTTRQN